MHLAGGPVGEHQLVIAPVAFQGEGAVFWTKILHRQFVEEDLGRAVNHQGHLEFLGVVGQAVVEKVTHPRAPQRVGAGDAAVVGPRPRPAGHGAGDQQVRMLIHDCAVTQVDRPRCHGRWHCITQLVGCIEFAHSQKVHQIGIARRGGAGVGMLTTRLILRLRGIRYLPRRMPAGSAHRFRVDGGAIQSRQSSRRLGQRRIVARGGLRPGERQPTQQDQLSRAPTRPRARPSPLRRSSFRFPSWCSWP